MATLPNYAGKMNRRVRLLRQDADAVDGFGQSKPQYVEVGIVWADVAFKSGKATIRSDSDAGMVQAAVRIRYRTDIEHGWRVEVLRYVDGLPVVEVALSVDASLPNVSKRDYTDLACSGVKNG